MQQTVIYTLFLFSIITFIPIIHYMKYISASKELGKSLWLISKSFIILYLIREQISTTKSETFHDTYNTSKEWNNHLHETTLNPAASTGNLVVPPSIVFPSKFDPVFHPKKRKRDEEHYFNPSSSFDLRKEDIF